MSFLVVLCFNFFYLKEDSLCLISYLLLESCFYASAPFYHAFMHMPLSFILSCCLSVFVWLFSFYLFFVFKIKKEKKSEKYKNSVCFVYIGTYVPWMTIETKFSKLCICTCIRNSKKYCVLCVKNIARLHKCIHVMMIWDMRKSL